MRHLLVALLAVALVGPAAPVEAHPLPHGATPRIVNLEPAPGEVVPAGSVRIRAYATSDEVITSHRVTVDGDEVASSRDGAKHSAITATVGLEPGVRTIAVTAATAAGERTRSWLVTVSGLDINRLAGADRSATAAAISADLHDDGSAPAAVLARSDDFPDALAGAALAGSLGGPVLLSAPDALPQVTADELARVLAPEATVHLLGGPQALSADVAAAVEALGFATERIAGADRHATAAAVAERIPEADGVIVASGRTFADAIAASAPAARDGWPVLLTEPDALPGVTAEAVRSRRIWEVVVVGGTAAVSDAVVEQLGDIVGPPAVSRVGGADRYETARLVGERFFEGVAAVGLASGVDFPDALAGGVHAGAADHPLLLVAPDHRAEAHADHVAALDAGHVVVYGGAAALGEEVVGQLHRARVDRGGPTPDRVTPATGEVVQSLDAVRIEMDRDVDVDASTVYVTLDGDEVAGRLAAGDFSRELVFTVEELPEGLRSGERYDVAVRARVVDGSTTRHLERTFTYRQPFRTLARGDEGEAVRALQRALRDNGYWVGPVDGEYGTLTHQAVLAVQKVHRMERTGAADEAVQRLLDGEPARPRPRTGPGDGLYYEVDLERQILMRVVDGRVEWIFNTSTGHGEWYTFGGSTYRATTTTGRHRITRQIDGARHAERGTLWRPKYYDNTRGIAIHGSTSVPSYPASAGCIRVTDPAMDFIWSLDPGVGAGVWVYPEDHYG